MANTILLKGSPLQKEGNAAVETMPGHLLRVIGDLVGPHQDAGQNAVPAFAHEFSLVGRGIDDVYEENERVIYHVYGKGDEVQAFLDIGENVDAGAWLESAGNGNLREHTPAPAQIVQAAIAALLETGDAGDDNDILWTARNAGSQGNAISIEMINTESGAALAVAVVGTAITVTLADAGAHASGITGVEGNDNGITWTAQDIGTAGNDILVVLQDPDGLDQDLEINVVGTAIYISLSTEGAGVIDSTAADIIEAITNPADPAYNAAAAALVTAADTGVSTGLVEVVDETVALAAGVDPDVTSDADAVIAAVEADADANALVEVSTTTGAGVVEPVDETNLSGGRDVGEIIDPGDDLYPQAIIGRALEAVDAGAATERIKVEVI